MGEPEIVDAAEVARRLNVGRATVDLWARVGVIPTLRLSRKVRRFVWGDVVAALRRQAEKPSRQNGRPS